MRKVHIFLTAGLLFSTIHKAEAIPPFAKQMGVECTQCHTVWPQLNAFGRQFKVKGYLDKSALGEPWMPFALRAKVGLTSSSSKGGDPNLSSNGNPAGSNLNTASNSTLTNFNGREFNLLMGGRITDDIGVWGAVTAAQDPGQGWSVAAEQVKIAFNLDKKHPASLVLMKSGTFGADPFPGLGGLDRHPWIDDSYQPLFQNTGTLMAQGDADSYGLIAHSYFGGNNNWYAAAGIQTGGTVQDPTVGTSIVSQQGIKGYARLAYDHPLGEDGGSYTLGTAYLWGPSRVNMPAGSPIPNFVGQTSRLLFDASVQLPMREKDLLQFVATYENGRDYNVRQFQNNRYLTLANAGLLDPSITDGVAAMLSGPQTVPIRGSHLEAEYYFNRTWGPMVGYDAMNIGGVNYNTLSVGVMWLPMRDLKIALEAQWQKTDTGQHNTLVGVNVMKYFWQPLKSYSESEGDDKEEKDEKKAPGKEKEESPAPAESSPPPKAETPSAVPSTAKTCQNCKHDNPPNALFCNQCGRSLTAPAPPAPK